MTAQLSNDSVAIKSWPWYLACLCMPLTTLKFAANLRPYEIIVPILILYALSGIADSRFRKLTQLDRVVMLYAVYQILVVLIGAEHLYESARTYRYLVLGPVLFYAAIRLLPFSIRAVSRAHIILIAIVLAQSLFVFYWFYQTGERSGGRVYEFVGMLPKFALTLSYVFLYLLFIWKWQSGIISRIVLIICLLIAIGGLLGVASRGVTAPTILMFLGMPLLWKSKHRRKMLYLITSISLIILVLLMAFSPPKIDYDDSQVLEDRKSVERLVSVQDYLMDMSGRVQFWAGIFDLAMQRPIFGHGAASFEIETGTDYQESLTQHNPHHSHNVLITSVLTGGLIGLSIMLALFFSMLKLLPQYSASGGKSEPFEKVLISSSIVFLVVAITNDIAGGVAIPFFFMLGLMQQIVIYGEIEKEEMKAAISGNQVPEGNNRGRRIAETMRRPGDNILQRKKEFINRS